MDWIDIVWTGMAAASLTLALIHLLVWNKQRSRKAHLTFTCTAVSVAIVGAFELAMTHARTPEEYATMLRCAQVAIVPLTASLVAFVRLYLGAGRAWLGHLAWGLRALALLPNFFSGAALNFRVIHDVREVQAWGGADFMVALGEPNPWMALGQVAAYVLLAFLLDAAWTAWRNRESASRARVVRVCASLALFVLLAGLWNVVIVFGGLSLPLAVLPAFTCVVMMMSYELGGDVVRAAQLAKDLAAVQGTLRESEQRIEDAVLAAGFGLWDWNLPRRETWLSPRARELLDVRADEPFTWATFLQRIETLDRQPVQSMLDRVREAGGPFLIECRIVHGDGALRWLLVRGDAEAGPDGKPVRLRGVLVDITERKRLEHESSVQRDELAHLSRVVLLAELSGSLAHELNQPLTAILSNAQAALRFIAHDPPDLGEVRESLVNIVESDKRAGEVIRRLRAMLRKEPAEFRPIDVNEIVVDVLRIVRSDLLNKNVEVHLELHPELAAGEGDRVQLQQVLLNLIVNASDAMRERVSGRELTITTAPASSGLQITVSDLGRGIPEADLERIFSPFVTSKPDGMGLGLAVCRSIIDSHGGRMWAGNNPGAGASLHFWLPATGAIPAQASAALHQGAAQLP